MQTHGSPHTAGKDFRRLAYRIERYLRLEATERLTVLTTYVFLVAIVFALATSAIFFLSTGVVKSLAALIGNETASYYIVGGLLVLLILLAILLKRPLIEARIVKKYSKKLLDTPTFAEQYMTSKENEGERLKELAQALAQELQSSNMNEKGGKK